MLSYVACSRVVVVVVVVPTPMADLVILIFARFLYASKHSA